ncbi:MAG: hypothetical protein HY695_33080 [Deltaproteobacteria bacterium]|nr:hypothetical protein [Deltaproteobacteria bacterium]
MTDFLKGTMILLLLPLFLLHGSNLSAGDLVTLTLPTVSDIIPSGALYTIQWEATPDAVNFNLTYSTDNGLTWELIKDGIIDMTYDWYTPVLTENKNNCRIRIMAYNSSQEIIGEEIADMFTIEAGN